MYQARRMNLEKIKIGKLMHTAQGDTTYPGFWREISFISDTKLSLLEIQGSPRTMQKGTQHGLLTFNGHAFTEEICGATVLLSRVSVLRIETCGEMDQCYLQSCRYLLLNLALWRGRPFTSRGTALARLPPHTPIKPIIYNQLNSAAKLFY